MTPRKKGACGFRQQGPSLHFCCTAPTSSPPKLGSAAPWRRTNFKLCRLLHGSGWHLEHAGGWEPFAGFVSPPFSGSAAFGVNGTYMRADALAQWTSEVVVVQDIVSIVGHPAASGGNASGPRVELSLLMPTSNLSSLEYALRFECGLKLGAGTSRSPPVLYVDGALTNGCFTLGVRMAQPWTPLAGTALEALVVPQMAGSIAVCNGTWAVDVGLLGPLFPSMSSLGLPSLTLPAIISVLAAKFPSLTWPTLPDIELLSLLQPSVSAPSFNIVALPSISLANLKLAYPQLPWPSSPELGLPALYNLLTIAFPDVAWPTMPEPARMIEAAVVGVLSPTAHVTTCPAVRYSRRSIEMLL